MSDAKPAAGAVRKTAKPSARRLAREFVLQALYQWQLAGQTVSVIEKQFADAEGFEKADKTFFARVLKSAVTHADATRDALVPHLDRPWDELSPIERGILLLSGHELLASPDVPYRVVINEAIELAKLYGGTDGHKYVNGVLDKLAAVARVDEIAHVAATGGRGARRPAA
jgi:transcription antitermination protein NusB